MFSYTVAVCLDDDSTRTFPAIDRSTAIAEINLYRNLEIALQS